MMFQPTDTAATLQDYLPLLTVIVATIGAYFRLLYWNRENKITSDHLAVKITDVENAVKQVETNLAKHADSPDHPTASEIRHVMNTLAEIQRKDVIDHGRIEGKVDRIYDHLIEKNHG